MPSPPRILIPGTTVFITSRTEEGLPFVARIIMTLILESVMARAQFLHPVKLCHYVWMGNHLHFLIFVEDPLTIEAFMSRVKTETAHAVNRLLGRRRRTVWVGDYDSVPILTVDDVVTKIPYIYTNPALSHLCKSISEYPGCSSWKAYTQGKLSIVRPWINRTQLTPQILDDPLAVERFHKEATNFHTLTLFPDAWMRSFGITDSLEKEKLNKKILSRIGAIEQELAVARAKEGRPVLGVPALTEARIDQPFTPKKWSRRAWCICCDVALRMNFIAHIKALRDQAKEVLRRWRSGDRTVEFPPGLSPPSFPRLASLITYVRPVVAA